MLKEKKIYLNGIEAVKDFCVNASSKTSTDVLVKSLDERYRIDGKSLLGIFSLDLSKEVIVVYDEQETVFAEYLKSLEK